MFQWVAHATPPSASAGETQAQGKCNRRASASVLSSAADGACYNEVRAIAGAVSAACCVSIELMPP